MVRIVKRLYLLCREYGVFPVRDPNGYQIIFHRLKIFDASKYVFTDGVKLLSMAIDAALHVEGTAPGYIFLFDMRGVKLTHLTRLSLSALRKFFLYVQVCRSSCCECVATNLV